MRSDVLELMAEEILGRPVGKLASFLRFDDGKPKLDGMHSGKRWDVLRGGDERAFEKETRVLLRKMSKRATCRRHAAKYNETSKAWHKRNRARRTKYEREYRAANKKKYREQQKAKRARQKADPARWALSVARWRRYRAKRKELAK